MLSVLLGTTTITMNRGEQETLYRQARNLRLHQAQHSNQQLNNNQPKPRHHSYGNIHQIHSTTSAHFNRQGMNLKPSLDEDQRAACDDLVLSVLKSPLRDQSLLSNLSSVGVTSAISECGSIAQMSTVTTLTNDATRLNINDNAASSPKVVGGAYTTLHASEDDLADDVELAMETTELNQNLRTPCDNSDLSPYGLKFLRRFRPPKFEAHHRRVPTPMKRKHNRGRSKSRADILDGTNAPTNEEEGEVEEVAIQSSTTGAEGGALLIE